MKKHYCLNCQHRLKTDICEKCSFDNSKENLDSLSEHEVKRLCYLQLKQIKSDLNYAYSFLIVGLILLVIGSVFLGLSFRFDVIGLRVFTPTSMEFIVSMITLAVSLGLLTLFCIKFFYNRSRKKFNEEILDKIKNNAKK